MSLSKTPRVNSKWSHRIVQCTFLNKEHRQPGRQNPFDTMQLLLLKWLQDYYTKESYSLHGSNCGCIHTTSFPLGDGSLQLLHTHAARVSKIPKGIQPKPCPILGIWPVESVKSPELVTNWIICCPGICNNLQLLQCSQSLLVFSWHPNKPYNNILEYAL